MPKSYSEQEREYIRKRLKEEAAKCLGTYGVRRTTVDEIVKRVKIPKGTFYLFYPSKEMLLFEVIQEQQETVNRQLYETISNMVGGSPAGSGDSVSNGSLIGSGDSVSNESLIGSGNLVSSGNPEGGAVSAEKLTDVIFEFFKTTEKMPILKLLNTGEVELLVRKLPREIVEAHFRDDTDTIGKMLALFPVKKEVDTKVISAAFHAIYFATLHKAEIGEEQYDGALRMLIYGVVAQIMGS